MLCGSCAAAAARDAVRVRRCLCWGWCGAAVCCCMLCRAVRGSHGQAEELPSASAAYQPNSFVYLFYPRADIMAKAMASPAAFLGKRRPSDISEQMNNDLAAAFDQSFKKIRIRAQDSPCYFELPDAENSCPQTSLPSSAKVRRDDLTTTLESEASAMNKPAIQTSYQFLEQQTRYLESQLASLKASHQMEMAQREAALTDLAASKLKLIAEIQRLQSEKEASQQEGRLLKKAVAIQDGRQRELLSQNAQLQDCLRLALEKIAAYEQVNRSLQYEVNILRGGSAVGGGSGFFPPPPPPPDVF